MAPDQSAALLVVGRRQHSGRSAPAWALPHQRPMAAARLVMTRASRDEDVSFPPISALPKPAQFGKLDSTILLGEARRQSIDFWSAVPHGLSGRSSPARRALPVVRAPLRSNVLGSRGQGEREGVCGLHPAPHAGRQGAWSESRGRLAPIAHQGQRYRSHHGDGRTEGHARLGWLRTGLAQAEASRRMQLGQKTRPRRRNWSPLVSCRLARWLRLFRSAGRRPGAHPDGMGCRSCLKRPGHGAGQGDRNGDAPNGFQQALDLRQASNGARHCGPRRREQQPCGRDCHP